MRIPSSRSAWCERPVTSVGLLVDGDDYYRAFYRAGQAAKREILLAGWQFDSDACLLRGPEAQSAELPVALLAYLDALCRRAPELRIYILAWDYHAVFAIEREWMQSQRFNWSTSDRLTFLFDSSHAEGASHHQKFAVIDGELAFLGGLDLCDHRWDDRGHNDPNPLRVSRGAEHRPFHDVQAYFVGREAAGTLVDLFRARWVAAGGDAIAPSEAPSHVGNPWWDDEVGPRGAVPLATDRLAFSRTDPQGRPNGAVDCHEVLALYVDAIEGAERFIYIENQYFSSREIAEALTQRMRAAGRPALEIVIVLNSHGESAKEEVAIGLAQAKIIGDLRTTAHETGHCLGIFYTVPATQDGQEPKRATYVHSKIMIVDDRFMTVGSANLTNRSMGLDTEINVSVQTSTADDALGASIRHARHSLVAEHLGIEDTRAYDAKGIAGCLLELAARKAGRLRIHPSPTEKERAVIDVIDPQQLPFDPGANESHDQDRSIFAEGLGVLWQRLRGIAGLLPLVAMLACAKSTTTAPPPADPEPSPPAVPEDATVATAPTDPPPHANANPTDLPPPTQAEFDAWERKDPEGEVKLREWDAAHLDRMLALWSELACFRGRVLAEGQLAFGAAPGSPAEERFFQFKRTFVVELDTWQHELFKTDPRVMEKSKLVGHLLEAHEVVMSSYPSAFTRGDAKELEKVETHWVVLEARTKSYVESVGGTWVAAECAVKKQPKTSKKPS